jgi:hypothetical protein
MYLRLVIEECKHGQAKDPHFNGMGNIGGIQCQCALGRMPTRYQFCAQVIQVSLVSIYINFVLKSSDVIKCTISTFIWHVSLVFVCVTERERERDL